MRFPCTDSQAIRLGARTAGDGGCGERGVGAAGLAAALFGVIAWLLLVWQRDNLQYELAHETVVGKPKVGPGGVWEILSTFGVDRLHVFLLRDFRIWRLQNFAPSLLRDVFDLSLAAATSALSIYLMGGACGLLTGGFLAKPGAKYEGTVTAAFGERAPLHFMLASAPLPKWLVLPAMAAMGFLPASPGLRVTCWCARPPRRDSAKTHLAVSMAWCIPGSMWFSRRADRVRLDDGLADAALGVSGFAISFLGRLSRRG